MCEEKRFCPSCGQRSGAYVGYAFLEMGEYNGKEYESEGHALACRCEKCNAEFWVDGPEIPESTQN